MATSLHHNLGGVLLPRSMIWIDEFAQPAMARNVEQSITGALIIDLTLITAGRLITLQGTDEHGWVRRAGLIPLFELAGTATEELLFTHADGRQFYVTFADSQPIDAQQLARAELPPANLPYIVTVRLIVVRPA